MFKIVVKKTLTVVLPFGIAGIEYAHFSQILLIFKSGDPA